MSDSKILRSLLFLDLAGTFVFAVEGSMAGLRGDLDLLGVLVLALVTALGGGIIRDLLIGDTPPAAFRDWRYPVTAFAGGVLVFFLHRAVGYIPREVILILDAVGLSLFAMAGVEKTLAFGMNPLVATLMGGVTGVGGGTVRDILLDKVPIVLRTEVYAVAALCGAVVYILCRKAKLSSFWSALLGAGLCFALRILSVWHQWHLPPAI